MTLYKYRKMVCFVVIILKIYHCYTSPTLNEQLYVVISFTEGNQKYQTIINNVSSHYRVII